MLIFQRASPPSNTIIYVGDMQVDKTSKVVNKDFVFTISKVAAKDAGVYECNYQSPAVKLTFEVDVQYPPTVKAKSKKSQSVVKGQNVMMECEATGNPKPVSLILF